MCARAMLHLRRADESDQRDEERGERHGRVEMVCTQRAISKKRGLERDLLVPSLVRSSRGVSLFSFFQKMLNGVSLWRQPHKQVTADWHASAGSAERG
jgi:hypothetical protein